MSETHSYLIYMGIVDFYPCGCKIFRNIREGPSRLKVMIKLEKS